MPKPSAATTAFSNLDIAIRDLYGWQNLDLGHDFHEVETLAENDRIR